MAAFLWCARGLEWSSLVFRRLLVVRSLPPPPRRFGENQYGMFWLELSVDGTDGRRLNSHATEALANNREWGLPSARSPTVGSVGGPSGWGGGGVGGHTHSRWLETESWYFAEPHWSLCWAIGHKLIGLHEVVKKRAFTADINGSQCLPGHLRVMQFYFRLLSHWHMVGKLGCFWWTDQLRSR